jgi:hypothetical protein
VNDQWTDLRANRIWWNSPLEDDNKVERVYFDVPLEPDLNGGYLEFSIYHFHPINYALDIISDDYYNDLRIKDISFSIVDSEGNPVNNSDVEYLGILNPKWKNEGEKITVYGGTNLDDYPIERGALLKYDTIFEPIQEWERAGYSGTTEELLLRSVVSNLENPQLQISANINRVHGIVGYITYNNYLDKKMLITAAEHNYANENTKITATEITADNLSVYLNY